MAAIKKVRAVAVAPRAAILSDALILSINDILDINSISIAREAYQRLCYHFAFDSILSSVAFYPVEVQLSHSVTGLGWVTTHINSGYSLSKR